MMRLHLAFPALVALCSCLPSRFYIQFALLELCSNAALHLFQQLIAEGATKLASMPAAGAAPAAAAPAAAAAAPAAEEKKGGKAAKKEEPEEEEEGDADMVSWN
jgi:hypothetical protein